MDTIPTNVFENNIMDVTMSGGMLDSTVTLDERISEKSVVFSCPWDNLHGDTTHFR